jgi:predicted nucleotidyltransferase
MEDNIKQILEDITKKIVLTCKPLKVILFGSTANGKMTKHSDFDILVIMKNGIHRRKTAQLIYRNIADIGFASDIIVVTEEDVKTYEKDEGTVIYPAIRNGKILYAA